MTDIVIVGAGGCAREVYEMALETYPAGEYRIKGFLSDRPADLDPYPDTMAEARILGPIADYEIQEMDRFLLAIGDVRGRLQVMHILKARGARFLSLIHPQATVFRNARLGEGVILYRFSGLSDHAVIGDFCLLNAFATVGHDAVLGGNVVACPFAAVGGGAKLGDHCFIGPHATIRPGVTIGSGSSVSANSFVARNAPKDSLIIGAPAKNM